MPPWHDGGRPPDAEPSTALEHGSCMEEIPQGHSPEDENRGPVHHQTGEQTPRGPHRPHPVETDGDPPPTTGNPGPRQTGVLRTIQRARGCTHPHTTTRGESRPHLPDPSTSPTRHIWIRPENAGEGIPRSGWGPPHGRPTPHVRGRRCPPPTPTRAGARTSSSDRRSTPAGGGSGSVHRDNVCYRG